MRRRRGVVVLLAAVLVLTLAGVLAIELWLPGRRPALLAGETYGVDVSAHPKTPLGRGKGVIVGMLGCFLIGLIWICTFYVFADKPEGEIWLIGDLGQLNLLVGIGFRAVGFTFATRWD